MPPAPSDMSMLDKSCRLCLSDVGVLSPIFQDSSQDTEVVSLPEKIFVSVDVKVTKDDNLPYQICHRCLYQVERSYEFKKQCKNSEYLLQAMTRPQQDAQNTSGTPESIPPLAVPRNKVIEEIMIKEDEYSVVREGRMVSEDPAGSEDPVVTEDSVAEEDFMVDLGNEESDHNMDFADGEGDYEEDEVSEADRALVENLATCPDLKIVQPPRDSSIKDLSMEVENQTETQYQCHLCSSSFLNQQHLWLHLVNHNTDGPPFSCPVCFQTFVQRLTLEEHWRSHSNETCFSCLLCNASCSSSGTLEEHVKMHSSSSTYNCSDCDDAFSTTSELRQHALVHAVLRPFKCKICPKEFSRSTNLNKHMRVHSGQRPYSCGECPKMFRTRGDMLRHQIIHTGQKPFSCSVCMISFNRKDKLTRHERLHLSEKPLSCTGCSMTFLRKDDLARHTLMHLNPLQNEEGEQETATDLRMVCKRLEVSKEDEASGDADGDADADGDGEGRLTIVEDTGSGSGNPEGDERSEVSGVDTSNRYEVESMVISVDPFHVNSQSALSACDSSTCWPQNLSVDKTKQAQEPENSAAKASNKPYTCDICNKKFSDKSYMKTHQLTHFGVRPHACGYCGKAFFRRRELLRHEAVHTGVKPFQCKICQKAFARSDKLMRHERTHGNSQQYPCSHCPAKFVRKDDLNRHEMTHTGQKPHCCSVCSKCFTTKAELTRHDKTHAVKEFKCEFCPLIFPRKDKLTAHLRTHEAAETENMDLKTLMAQCTRFGNDPVKGSEFHLVPLKQN